MVRIIGLTDGFTIQAKRRMEITLSFQPNSAIPTNERSTVSAYVDIDNMDINILAFFEHEFHKRAVKLAELNEALHK